MGKIFLIEEIEDISRSSSYLLKYIQKSTNPSDEKDFHFFNGWKKKNKIRVFTHSNLDLERYIFKKVNSVLKLSKDLKDKNPITELLEKCHIEINTKDYDTKKIKAKKYKNKNGRYEVIINRTRKISNNIETQEFLVRYTKDDVNIQKKYYEMQREAFSKKQLEKNAFYQELHIMNDELFLKKENTTREKIYSYKIDDFIIIDKKTKEILYNKKDILLLG